MTRLRWAGHLQRMTEERIPKRVLGDTPCVKRPTRRPQKKWVDGIEEDFKGLGVRVADDRRE